MFTMLRKFTVSRACVTFFLLACLFASQAAPAPPRSIASFPEKPVLVQTPDAVLHAFFMDSSNDRQAITVRRSRDLGDTWEDESLVAELPPEPGAWTLPEALTGNDGEIHLFLLNDANTGVIETGEDKRPKEGGMNGRRLDIWHMRSREKLTRWEAPKKIWEGYTGALNSVIQMKSGRILLPFSYWANRTWSNRGDGLDAFTFRGHFDSTLVLSDNGGDTWTLPPVRLKVPVPDIVSAYGAVEPVVIQLLDGRVWMLIRTQQGRFYESFSRDGSDWSEPVPSRIMSSDSPAGVVRLTSGRLMLFWNNCQRYPYAYGGRQVLHAAVSNDDGRTWHGYREVARDPLRNQPPPPGGDHGTAYPFPIALLDGRAVCATGQGEGRALSKVIDPEWLLETRQEERFADGLENWSVFGTRGVELVPHPERSETKALSIRKTEAGWPACAVWNFPAFESGSIRIRLQARDDFQGARIGITDHFSTPFDQEDIFYNLFNAQLSPSDIQTGTWHDVELRWDTDARVCTVSIDGHERGTLRQTRESAIACYLRVAAASEDTTDGGILIESVIAEKAQNK